MADGGYATPTLWLMDGFATVGNEEWQAPGHWREIDGEWQVMTLGGLQPVDPRRPGLPCQLLRGGCVRALERQAFADRNGMGSRRPRRPAQRRLRHRLAMDPQRLRPLPRLPGDRRRARRIQRQVHGQPAGAARLLACNSRTATAVSPIATSFIRIIAGNSRDCASPTTPPDFSTFKRAGKRVQETVMNVHAPALAKAHRFDEQDLGICRRRDRRSVAAPETAVAEIFL